MRRSQILSTLCARVTRTILGSDCVGAIQEEAGARKARLLAQSSCAHDGPGKRAADPFARNAIMGGLHPKESSAFRPGAPAPQWSAGSLERAARPRPACSTRISKPLAFSLRRHTRTLLGLGAYRMLSSSCSRYVVILSLASAVLWTALASARGAEPRDVPC